MFLIRRYFHNFAKHKLLGKYLFLTNTLSSAGLMALGDALQQQIELSKQHRKSGSYDWIRTYDDSDADSHFEPGTKQIRILRRRPTTRHTPGIEHDSFLNEVNMTAIGLPLGVAQHFFYKYMDLILPHRTLLSVSKKIILDQLIASPVCIVIFFYGLGMLEEGSFEKTQDELKKKFFSIYMVDWIVWPPTQYINFAYLSPRYRVVYINFITMLYDVFLSYIKYNDKYQKVNSLD